MAVGSSASQKRSPQARVPSASGYMLAAGAAAAALFFMLWWMLLSGGDDAPWIPAGLAASVVMLVAVAAREVVMRRAWTRYILEHDRRDHAKDDTSRSGRNKAGKMLDANAAALHVVQRQSAEADAPGALPEAHLEAYLLCQEYLDNAAESLRSSPVGNQTRVALHVGKEQVRALARHHMLDWAREESRKWTSEAQQRVRMSDKIETAQRALDVISSAINLYPEEIELHESEAAVHEFIASVKVSHWIELAERAAFKGYLTRAIDRYRDALYFLSRSSMKEETRAETAERIGREIELLRARIKTRKMSSEPISQETVE